MKTLNNVQLIGYLGRDPVIKEYTPGNPMAIIRLATHTYSQPKEGEPIEFTQWHTVIMWGQEEINKWRNYLVKGSHIMVVGQIVYRSFIGSSGKTHFVTEIKANYLVDLDR